MISIPSLWLPILLSGVLVFVASSVIHMLLPYHKSDFEELPDQDGVMDALRGHDIPPGEYMFPRPTSAAGMRSEEFKAKVERGPVGGLTIYPSSAMFNMGPQLTQWFVYCLVVAIVAAYLGGRVLAAGTDYLTVFRVTGTVAFACYAMGIPQRSIWYRQKWSTTLKSVFDGLVYASLTGGTFGWLWPG